MFERFTDRAKRVLVVAQDEARTRNHNGIRTEHLLLSLIHVGGGEADNIMESLGIVPAAVRQAVEEIVREGHQEAPSGPIPFTPQAKKVLELSLRASLRLGDNHIDIEHLLLGMVREGEGVAAQLLVRFGADVSSINRLFTRSREGSAGTRSAARTSGDTKRTGPFEQFTHRARRVIVIAQEEARMLNHDYIGTEHLLLGLIHEGEGVAANVLASLDITLGSVRQQVEEIIGLGQQPSSGFVPFTPRVKKVLELSLREALQLGDTHVDTEHILLSLVREREGVGAQVLLRLGADLVRVRTQILTLLGQGPGGTRPKD